VSGTLSDVNFLSAHWYFIKWFCIRYLKSGHPLRFLFLDY
jgi:hypothetical protein